MKWRLFALFLVGIIGGASAQDYKSIPTEPKPGDEMLSAYFDTQVEEISSACFAGIKTAEDWQKARGHYREQLFEMLGIQPQRERTALNAKVTGSQNHDGILVENVVFQSLPGLYVTGNFYRPVGEIETPLPAILYGCGHSPQKALGISYGNKTAYHHHGVWFAKHGYACLVIDTIQLGEIEGIHHGTYREGRWWWNSRGYTPAGVEAWNGIRALDYLQSRPEVDDGRIGMTGRSGGGVYTWWVAALDERVKVAVPVAGITSLRNQVVDGVVEGHCDCMFHVNTYRWDFPQIAALIAPRPLLITNTDKDTIFPLDGVVDVYTKARRVYELLGVGENIGLSITEGPHKDTQPLRSVAFHWLERHLKGTALDDEVDTRAPKVLDRPTMRVLEAIPSDESVTTIDETFVATAPEPKVPANAAEWGRMRDSWMIEMREKVFRGWPNEVCPLNVLVSSREEIDGVLLARYGFDSQQGVRLPLVVAMPKGWKDGSLRMIVVGEDEWSKFADDDFKKLRQEAGEIAVALLAPRGIGPTAWTDDKRERVHVRRRFMLVGQTLDGMRVWDIRRGLAALRSVDGLGQARIDARASGVMGVHLLYASLFEEPIHSLALGYMGWGNGNGGAVYLNVRRLLSLPVAIAMAAERCPLKVTMHRATRELDYAGLVLEVIGKRERLKMDFITF